jgi:hypothetical protein
MFTLARNLIAANAIQSSKHRAISKLIFLMFILKVKKNGNVPTVQLISSQKIGNLSILKKIIQRSSENYV